VGSSVVAIGLISLPVMLKNNYYKPAAAGVICALSTLGQIIPPSIILIILGYVMGVPVGDYFSADVLPGELLIVVYTLYILRLGKIKPEFCPPMETTEDKRTLIVQAMKDILLVTVLGSILTGLDTPSESAVIGALGAVVLSVIYGRISFKGLHAIYGDTVKVTTMIFAVLVGAKAFSMVFSYSGSEYLVEEFFTQLPTDKWTFIVLAMLTVLILGFFIEISFW
jgi:tripartite ATP-independent transporter DctM subunit